MSKKRISKRTPVSMKNDNNNYLNNILPIKNILIVVFVVFSLMLLFAYLPLLLLRGDLFKVDATEFLSSAMWAQVLVAIIGALISYYLLTQVSLAQNQVSLIQDQIELSRKTSTAEAAKILTSERSVNTRKFLNQQKVIEYFKNLSINHACLVSDEDGNLIFDKKLFDAELNKIRNEVSELSREISPFLSQVKLDDVEFLLNQYNYIAMLVEYRVFDEPLITDMAKKNAINIYNIVKPYIEFRRQTQSHKGMYANHYMNWVEGETEKLNK